MLFRRIDGTDDAVIAIPQPSHAWLSGQIARAWGNDAFDPPAPREAVCLGIEQHDIAWLGWEAEPTLNPATGRPHAFHEVATTQHRALWAQGVRLARGFGLYPALLVSLHANTLYDRYFKWDTAAPEDAAAARALLDDMAAFQRSAVAALAADPHTAPHVAPAALERNRLLLAAADWMSLVICQGLRGDATVTVPNVPAAGESTVALRLSAPDGDPARLSVAPWPFTAARVELMCEGRRLSGRFTDAAAMRAALDGAERVPVGAVLEPPAA